MQLHRGCLHALDIVERQLLSGAAAALADHPVLAAERDDDVLARHLGRDGNDPELLAVEQLGLVHRREVPGAVDHHGRLAVDELRRRSRGLAPVETRLGRGAVADQLAPQRQRLHAARLHVVAEQRRCAAAIREKVNFVAHPHGVEVVRVFPRQRRDARV